MNFMTFHNIGTFIIPTDELIFFRGVGIPPTRFDILYPIRRFREGNVCMV